MKKIILAILFFTSFSYSQTTQEEYNYLTKGYREQISKGLDLKKGYQFENLLVYKSGRYTFDFKVFLTDEKLSSIYVSVNSEGTFGNNVYDICIPFDNDELTNNYNDSLASWDLPISKAYISALTHLYSTFFYNSLMEKLIPKTVVKPKLVSKKK